MRTIDADALKKKAFGRRGGLVRTADIDAMPTVDGREAGKWAVVRIGISLTLYVCSVCGLVLPPEVYGLELYGDEEWPMNYCPKCGSYMRRKTDAGTDDNL